jgi:uncharacterized membrane-anchored protein
MKKWILWANLILALGVINGLILQKEKIVRTGETVFLKLASYDERSLMQGDYMQLKYDMTRRDPCRDEARAEGDGCLVILRDERGVASFRRIHRGESLSNGELLLRFRFRDGVCLGAETFFIQEDLVDIFKKAAYGELRVAPSGESVLVGLRDRDLKVLGSGAAREEH